MHTLFLIVMVLLAGCDHLAIEQRTSTAAVPREVELDRQPRGVAEAHLTERPNHDGWIVDVTQDYAVTTETQLQEERIARRYHAWPLAPLTGLLQCPIGGLFALTTSFTTMGSVGCHRLIGQEPLANTRPISSTIERTRQTTITSAPVSHAIVTVSDPATDTVLFRDTTNDRGVVTIPTYSRTDGQPSAPAVITVAEGPIVLARRTLTPAPSQGWEAPKTNQEIAWPATPIFQIQTRGPADTAEAQLVRGALQGLLLREGVCVVGPPHTIRTIQQEQGLQLAGRVSDHTPVRTGYLLAPTILITVEIATDGAAQTALLTFTNVQDATALAVMEYTVPTNTRGSISNETTGRIHQLLEGAQKKGCPLTKS